MKNKRKYNKEFDNKYSELIDKREELIDQLVNVQMEIAKLFDEEEERQKEKEYIKKKQGLKIGGKP